MKKNEETKKAANGGKQLAVDMMTENKLNTTTPATVDTPKKMFNLNNIYFDPLQISPDAPIRSALSPIGDIMRQRGFSEGDIRLLLKIVVSMLSAKLGLPIALIIVDEGSEARELLTLAKKFVPRDIIFECTDLPIDHLYMAAQLLPGKAIVNADFERLRKVQKDIEMLVECGNTVRQEKISSKFKKSLEPLEIKGPVAMVTIAPDMAKAEWKGPSALRVTFSPSQRPQGASILKVSDLGNDDDFFVDIARISKFFERLTDCKVSVPFADDIRNHMKSLKVSPLESTMRPLLSLISLCTLINNPAPVSEAEIAATLYGIDKRKLGKWLALRGYEISNPVEIDETIKIASKIDYYVASMLLGNQIHADGNTLSERQLRVFDAIKRRNLGRIGESAFVDVSNQIEKLATIATSTDAWAGREKIFEEANKEPGDFISLATINVELQELVKKGVIERQKVTKTNKYGYYMMMFDTGGSIKLPPASEIIDPLYKGQTVKVVNPLTGNTEEI